MTFPTYRNVIVGQKNKIPVSIHRITVAFVTPKLTGIHPNTSSFTFTNATNSTDFYQNIPQSSSVPSDLQLCGCYLKDIANNTSQLSHMCKGRRDEEPEKSLNDLIRPRKLQLDKTLAKYKLNKSLPVSPVNEERSFSDYVEQKRDLGVTHLEKKMTADEGFKKICSDIEKFSEDFNKKYEQIEQNFDNQIEGAKINKKGEDDGSFSSDSLEDYSASSAGDKKQKKTIPPRRKYQKSESFYLNQNIKTSQDSILSDENVLEYDLCVGKTKSYCNSMESVLSNESDCKSAPLEILFGSHKRNMSHSQSLPKNMSNQYDIELSSSLPKNYSEIFFDSITMCNEVKRSQSMCDTQKIIKANMKTCQTQTDFESPQEIVSKKARGSDEFQRKRYSNLNRRNQSLSL
ncbi:hypothetical protein NQ317_008217 [Molorchus minor]|uniref:Uncharacterized protein n=1 Tax=Molorchus minor TaxID=1323400 RepID=A0ABQ9JUM6_9CUCU|nr:hypothetical protein NQ317_008217 [Molorchus minor]